MSYWLGSNYVSLGLVVSLPYIMGYLYGKIGSTISHFFTGCHDSTTSLPHGLSVRIGRNWFYECCESYYDDTWQQPPPPLSAHCGVSGKNLQLLSEMNTISISTTIGWGFQSLISYLLKHYWKEECSIKRTLRFKRRYVWRCACHRCQVRLAHKRWDHPS